MAIIHISEAEAARDLPALLAKVRAGEEIRIDSDSESFVIVPSRRLVHEQPRLMSEILADLKKDHANSLLDDQFGNDLEEIIRLHEHERLIDPWESF